MEKTENKEVKAVAPELIEYSLSKDNVLLISECLSITVSHLGTKDPNATNAIFQLDAELKNGLK